MMKKTFLALTLMMSLVSLTSYGQASESGQAAELKYTLLSEWYEQQGTYFGYLDNRTFTYGEGEGYRSMEIGGKTYMIVRVEGVYLPTLSRKTVAVPLSDDFVGIRMEGGRVYANYANYLQHLGEFGHYYYGDTAYLPYPQTDDGEIILYDYNMEVGDKYLSVDGYDDVSVVAKDVVVLKDQKEHRRLTLSNGMILIEDIGCINSPGMLLNYLNPASFSKDNLAFLEYSMSYGQMVYVTEHRKIVDLRTLGVSSLPDATPSTPLYDLQGRCLIQKPEHGLYIQGGRKVVIK